MILHGLSPERFARLDALLDALLDTPPAQQRQRARALCEGDDALFEELDALLSALRSDDAHPLDRTIDPTLALEASEDPLEGQRAGPYELVELLGVGGMGTVFRARRADGAYDRDVAVKVVRRGMDSLAILDRFHREREILARLEHPGIVRLVDAGLLDDGRPYLAMDLVKGEPLLEVARDRSIRERVALIEQICRAVSYAHARLVIHRDIKPSNVLVADGDQPLLLDFGVAKLVDDDEHTGAAERMLTPRWAAPEQFEGQVDVRTDVFAIGLLLHAVLTARPSVERNEDGSCPRPSSVAAASERARVLGDLDAITSTALRLDPDHRYPSARALADDLERYLRGLPVVARPERGYRVRKAIARNIAAIGVAALFVVSLIVYSITITGQSRALEAQRDRAEAHAERSEQLSDFLRSLLNSEHAQAVDGEEITVAELLARAQRRLDDDALEDDTRAELKLITARALYTIGHWDEALALARQVATDETLSSTRRASAANFMAGVELAARQPRRVRELGLAALSLAASGDGFLSPAAARSYDTIASGAMFESPYAARALYALSVFVVAITQGPLSPELARPLVNLSTMSAGDSKLLMRWALAVLRLGPSREAELADAMHKYARATDDRDASLEWFEQALAIERRLYGEHHPFTLNTLNDIGLGLERSDPERSIALLTEIAEALATRLPPEHPRRLLAELNLGAVLRDTGHLEQAGIRLTRALRVAETAESYMMVSAAWHVGELRIREGAPGAAIDAFARGLPRCETSELRHLERLATSWLQVDRGPTSVERLRACLSAERIAALLEPQLP